MKGVKVREGNENRLMVIRMIYDYGTNVIETHTSKMKQGPSANPVDGRLTSEESD